MLFVRLGSLLAWGLLIVGVLVTVMGLSIAGIGDPAAYEAAVRRYLGSGTSGQAIDKGLIYIASGIVVGLLVRIASKPNG